MTSSPWMRLFGWLALVIALAVVVQVGGVQLGLSSTARIAIFAGVYFAARVASTFLRRRKWLAQSEAVRAELQSTDPEPFVSGVARRAVDATGADPRAGGIAASARAIASAVYGDRERALRELEMVGQTPETSVSFDAARAAIALFCDRDPRAARSTAREAPVSEPTHGVPKLPAFARDLINAVYAASLAATHELPDEAQRLLQRIFATSSEPLTRLIATWAAAVMEQREGKGEGENAEFLRDAAPHCAPLQQLV